jgi:flagellar biosynthesis protein FliQ
LNKHGTNIVEGLYSLILILAGIVTGLILSIPKLTKAVLKSLTFVFLSIITGILYLITFVVPFIGEYIIDFRKAVKSRPPTSNIISKTRVIRGMMVEIAAEHGEGDLDFEEPERYREELSTVKQKAKLRLGAGETVISLTLGAILTIGSITNFNPFNIRFSGYSVSILVQILVLMLTVSIIYRMTILELLSYSNDAEFSSLPEMDAALAYQKGVALIDRVQALTTLAVYLMIATKVKKETLRTVLTAKYKDDLPITDWLPLAWKTIRKNGIG